MTVVQCHDRKDNVVEQQGTRAISVAMLSVESILQQFAHFKLFAASLIRESTLR